MGPPLSVSSLERWHVRGEAGPEKDGLGVSVPADVLQALPPPRRSGISASEEEVTPEHRLW